MAEAVEQLIAAMNDELQHQRDLKSVLEQKLDAMRHYDISRLHALTIAEQRLLDAIRANGHKRTESARRAGEELFEGRLKVLPTARQIAAKTPEPAKRKLMALTTMLREVVQNVQRLNRVNNLSCRKILEHFDHIFRIIAQSGRDIGLYGSAGKKSLLEQNRLFDGVA